MCVWTALLAATDSGQLEVSSEFLKPFAYMAIIIRKYLKLINVAV
jgi:hypothetical protein